MPGKLKHYYSPRRSLPHLDDYVLLIAWYDPNLEQSYSSKRGSAMLVCGCSSYPDWGLNAF